MTARGGDPCRSPARWTDWPTWLSYRAWGDPALGVMAAASGDDEVLAGFYRGARPACATTCSLRSRPGMVRPGRFRRDAARRVIMDEYLMDVRQCAGFGRTDRPIHELTADIYACDDCIAEPRFSLLSLRTMTRRL